MVLLTLPLDFSDAADQTANLVTIKLGIRRNTMNDAYQIVR
jgi:hypothetical protein